MNAGELNQRLEALHHLNHRMTYHEHVHWIGMVVDEFDVLRGENNRELLKNKAIEIVRYDNFLNK